MCRNSALTVVKPIDSDVVIIGGGPAGLCTAIELALVGIKSIVCEKKNFPIDKPCGEGIMPQGVHHLERLGVLAYIDKNHMSAFDGVCFVNQQGARAQLGFDGLNGMGIRRIALSQALYKRAKEFKQISFLDTRVSGLKLHAQGLILKTEQGELKARLVVGADGIRSSARTWAQLQDKRRTFKRYGLRMHFRIRPWSPKVEVYFSPGLEAYITPCGPEQTNITLLWNKDKKFDPRFESLIKFFPALCERLSDQTPCSEERACGPLQHRCREPIAEGIALVGDASGYFDAITGEGNSIALSQAQALAPIVAQALNSKNPVLSKGLLQPYARAHRAIVSHYYRNTQAMLLLAKFPRLMNSFIAFGSKYPKVFSYIIAQSRALEERKLSRQLTAKSVEL